MLIHLDATPAAEGGAGMVTYLLGLIRGWKAAGFDDRWVVDGSQSLALSAGRAWMDVGTVRRSGPGGPLGKFLVQQARIPYAIRARRPDVLLSISPVVPLARLHVPIVVVVADVRHLVMPDEFSRWQRLYRQFMWPAGLKRATRLIAISNRTRDDVVARYPFTADKIETVYLGSDHVAEVPRRESQGHGLAFARWSNKRPDFVVRVWAELNRRRSDFNVPLHIVGASARTQTVLRDLSGHLGVGPLVRVHQFLPEDEYWDLFAAAGLVLFPSTFEGFGLPVLEAMRLRVPVVTWRDPAINEIAGDFVTYADPHPGAFADECNALLSSGARRLELVERAYLHACSFNWQETAERTRAELIAARAAYPP